MNDPAPASVEPQPPPDPPKAKKRRRLGCWPIAGIGCGVLVVLAVALLVLEAKFDDRFLSRILNLHREIEAQLGFFYSSPYARDEKGHAHEVIVLTEIDPGLPFDKAGLRAYDEPDCGISKFHLGLYEAHGKTLRFTVTRNRADIVRTWNLDVSGPPDAPDLVDVIITLPDGTQAVRRVRQGGERVTVEVAVPILKFSDDPAILRKSPLPFVKVQPCGEILDSP